MAADAASFAELRAATPTPYSAVSNIPAAFAVCPAAVPVFLTDVSRSLNFAVMLPSSMVMMIFIFATSVNDTIHFHLKVFLLPMLHENYSKFVADTDKSLA